MRDPYKRLGISREAGEEEIREARSYLASQVARLPAALIVYYRKWSVWVIERFLGTFAAMFFFIGRCKTYSFPDRSLNLFFALDFTVRWRC